MGSPLGPVLGKIFMVHVERKLIHTNPWKRYVDDTISKIKKHPWPMYSQS